MYDKRSISRMTTVFTGAVLAACQPTERAGQADESRQAHVVEVTAREYTFDAPAEIPSGWTTFRMTNAGEQEHFLALWPLPEDRTFEDYAQEIVAPFEQLTSQYRAGSLDRTALLDSLGRQLPEWFASVIKGAGGPGVTAPGRTSQTTVRLEPGTYVMECYVRTPDGDYHNMLGMLRPLRVTEEASGALEPEADIGMTLSNYAIETTGDLSPGQHTVRVHVAEDPEGLLPHDVHLARLEAGTSPDEVVRWMDWIDALRAGAPVVFLGGVEQMPAGSAAYFTVDLDPGRYLWVSESYGAQGMAEEFVVN